MYQIINTKENWIVGVCNTMAEACGKLLSYYESDRRLNNYEKGIYKIVRA